MAPQATTKLATRNTNKKTDNSSTVKSKYWNNTDTFGSAKSILPLPKKRRTDGCSTSHEPGQTKLQSLTVGSTTTVANKEQYKRKYQDIFDFSPETAPDIKEEPRDETATARPATLTQHFTTTKSGQPAAAPKTTPLSPKRDAPPEISKGTTGALGERSAVVAALAYVHDGGVTEAVAALVLRWARETQQGDAYDPEFIRGILADLDAHRIDSDRRAFVTEMLARPLQQQLETLRSSSESLLSCLASINTPQPSSSPSRKSRQSE
ncbi:hypothetical protein Q7P35_006780 [Cladosporium inversicolor]